VKKVAVVDDDEGFSDFLTALLSQAGHDVSVYGSAGRFLDSLEDGVPDLAVLDLQMPGLSGWALIRLLKDMEETRAMPVIAVSGQFLQSSHIVRVLGMGADEYFSKPLDGEVFLAQVAALFRRAVSAPLGISEPAQTLSVDDVSVDIPAHEVKVGGESVHLTPLEFDLLVHFLRNRNRVLTRGHILQHVWKSDPTQSTRTVDKRVEALRKKLGRLGRSIATVSGVGYCLRA